MPATFATLRQKFGSNVVSILVITGVQYLEQGLNHSLAGVRVPFGPWFRSADAGELDK